MKKMNFKNVDLEKTNLKKITSIYLLMYFVLFFIRCSSRMPTPIGEWDDYCFPAAQIITSGNFSFTEDDLTEYKALFPEWADAMDNYSLSGYTTRSGGQMAWYFPTYSAACVPLILLLRFLRLPTCFAFPYTNLASIMVMLLVVFYCLKVSDRRKLLIIGMLSMNPVVFYFDWPSAETFIFSMLGIAFTFWYNRWYKSAAFAVSIAGMLNPTILSIGIVMIIEYMIRLVKSRKKGEGVGKFLGRNIKGMVCYGACYLIGLVPMAYNYYHTGHINLTAASFGQGRETVFYRFLAYLFDLNFGILPYYAILLIAAMILTVVALKKRYVRFLGWMTAFYINIYLYSIMMHINCGMTGIARYNAWGSVVLIFAVCLYFDEILQRKALIHAAKGALGISAVVTGLIVVYYGYDGILDKWCRMTPIAEWALDEMPSLYNPLHSTFCSRVLHVDGGYTYETPIVYINDVGTVKKILATDKDAEILKTSYTGNPEDTEWFWEQLDGLTVHESYISIPKDIRIIPYVPD